MADLIQIQYEVVDKGKSLKTALTGVERMEKSLAKLSKEITSGTMTQDRQRKALIAYGRELKRLTGMTGTQAYGAVVKYKNALVNQTLAQNKAAIASQRLAKVQDYLASRQERATLSTQRQNAALHQTKNRMNGSNMAVQQLGYQFGDFAVQVQGGTSAFVAFSQQASQLVGILPMVAGPLGLSMGAAVGLSAALGILIPIGSAIGRMFMEMNTSANEAAAKIKKFEDNLKSAKAETVDMAEALRLLRSGFETEGELALNDALVKARDHLREMLKAQKDINAAAFVSDANKADAQSIAQVAVDKAQEALDLAREDARVHREAAAALEKEKDRQKRDDSVINQLAEAREVLRQQGIKQEKEAVKESKKRAEAIYDAVLAHKKVNDSAQQELDLLTQKNVLLDLELQYGKDSSVYKQVALGFEEDNLRKKLELKGVDETIIAAQIRALAIQGKITGELADQLTLKKLQAQFEQKPMGNRGDPRKQGGSFIDWRTIEATKFLEDYENNLRKTTKATEGADKATEALRKELEAPMVKAIDSVSNAFGDFIADGLKDFKSFAKSIVSSFKSMISQMIATAARNKIMLSLGMGGTGFAGQAAAGQVAGIGANSFFGGPIGSAIGSFAGGGVAGTGFLGGLGAAGSGAMAGYASGGLAGGASGLFSVGANAAAAGGGMMATLGAAVPVIGAVALAVGFLSKKVKVLDEGARFSANGLDVLGESMKKLKTTRFFGLSKKTSTNYEASDPLTQALEGQLNVVKSLARQLDFSTDALKDFTYEVEFSTKGLSEAEIAQKYALELQKFGDAAAGAIAGGATIADLRMRADAPRRRLAELLESDPLLGYNIEVMQQAVNSGMRSFRKAFKSMPEIISENMDEAVGSVSVGFAHISGAANAVRDYLYTTLGNLNEILGYSAGGPMGNLSRIGDTLDRILEPAEQALARLGSSFGDQARVFNEVRESGLATTEQIQQMDAAMSAAANSLAQAALPISTIRGGYSVLSSAVSDLFSEQVEEGLRLAFPEAADNLSAFVKGIIGTVSEGSVSEFEAAFVNLADAFGEGNVNASDFNTAMEVMNQVFRGNISLTEEYTTTQQKAVDSLSNAFNTLKEGLEGVVGTIESALETLTGKRQDLLNTTATRDKSLSYLRGIAATGQIPTGDQSSFNAAIQAVSNIETTGFRTATEMLRYIGQTSGVLSSIQSQAEQQLTDAEVQVKAILKIQDTNETSAEALVSIDSAIKEFLGAGGRIPQFASGGYHSGGLRIVGENGPELEATGPSRIVPNSRISVGNNSELRREVAEMRVDLKSALVQIAKNTRKSSDTLNKFDYQGLPNSRGY